MYRLLSTTQLRQSGGGGWGVITPPPEFWVNKSGGLNPPP